MDVIPSPCIPDRITGLPPVTGNAPRTLILGSFPSRMSLAASEYYGNPWNHFWHVAGSVLGIDPALPYAARLEGLTARGIALWDVVYSCLREGSADNRIRDPVYNALAGFLAQHPSVKLVALNGTTAGRFWHAAIANSPPRSQVAVIVLPSTSPANARITLAEKARWWEVIRT